LIIQLSLLSSDGKTLAIVQYSLQGGVCGVVIYDRTPGNWTVSQLVVVNHSSSCRLGCVSLNYYGNTLAVGGEANNSGLFWVFTRNVSQNKWTQIGQNIANLGANCMVKLNSHGNILALSRLTTPGYVGIYSYINESWGPEQNFENIGTVISLSGDENILAIGDEIDDNSIGCVRLFSRSQNGTWIQFGRN
jgi:hypothetical protein